MYIHPYIYMDPTSIGLPPIAPAFVHQLSVLCPLPLIGLLDVVLPGNSEFSVDGLLGDL